MYGKDSEVLEEVVVTGKLRSEKYHKRQALIKKYKSVVFDIGKYYNVELPETYSYNADLMTYLRNEQSVRLVNKGIESSLVYGAGSAAILHIDGVYQDSYSLGTINLDMEEVEAIMIEPISGSIKIQVSVLSYWRS